jgi:uncharacterized membrane protein
MKMTQEKKERKGHRPHGQLFWCGMHTMIRGSQSSIAMYMGVELYTKKRKKNRGNGFLVTSQ